MLNSFTSLRFQARNLFLSSNRWPREANLQKSINFELLKDFWYVEFTWSTGPWRVIITQVSSVTKISTMCCKMLAITVNIYKSYGKSDIHIYDFFYFYF